MSQSVAQVYLHIIFSTKHRAPLLGDHGFRGEMHRYLAKVCQSLGFPAIEIGGIEDHVHLLCRLGRTLSLADFLRDLKRSSSMWPKEHGGQLADFYWQGGYGAFSISPAHVDRVQEYIRNQEEHHRQESFQDEFRRICRKYGVELDERYAWD
jgi:REP element-mobilizing transposase RayT